MSAYVWVVEVLPRGSSHWRPVERNYSDTFLSYSSRKKAEMQRSQWTQSVREEVARYRVSKYARTE
jgi:hypothetical protein